MQILLWIRSSSPNRACFLLPVWPMQFQNLYCLCPLNSRWAEHFICNVSEVPFFFLSIRKYNLSFYLQRLVHILSALLNILFLACRCKDLVELTLILPHFCNMLGFLPWIYIMAKACVFHLYSLSVAWFLFLYLDWFAVRSLLLSILFSFRFPCISHCFWLLWVDHYIWRSSISPSHGWLVSSLPASILKYLRKFVK